MAPNHFPIIFPIKSNKHAVIDRNLKSWFLKKEKKFEKKMNSGSYLLDSNRHSFENPSFEQNYNHEIQKPDGYR